MVDADLRRLGWSIASYYFALVLLVLLGQDTSHGIGHALVSGLGAPFLMIALCVVGLSVDNMWIASTINLTVLIGLCAAMWRLWESRRIAVVLALLTVAVGYGFYIGSIVGA